MFKVLVVDDSKMAKKRVISSLEGSSVDCEVIATADDGEQGLKNYIEHRPNLVITDIEMPNMDGREFVEKLKKINEDLPIIAITSMVNEKIKKELMSNNNVYVLHKPIDNKLLGILLEKLNSQFISNKGE